MIPEPLTHSAASLGRWLAAVPLVLGYLAVWLLMPRARALPRRYGVLLGAGALVSAALAFVQPGAAVVHDVLFVLFSAVAVTAAVCMITTRNPVYAALWFAVVTLGSCGLVLLQAAPFLAVSMVIVYAGAIIVTFLFLIMLAHQAVSGAARHQDARQPFAATSLGFVLLGGLLCALQHWGPMAPTVALPGAAPLDAMAADQPAVPGVHTGQLVAESRAGTVRGLGRTLFGEYVYAVELSGTLLLVASVGAIAIALHSSRRTP